MDYLMLTHDPSLWTHVELVCLVVVHGLIEWLALSFLDLPDDPAGV